MKLEINIIVSESVFVNGLTRMATGVVLNGSTLLFFFFFFVASLIVKFAGGKHIQVRCRELANRVPLCIEKNLVAPNIF